MTHTSPHRIGLVGAGWVAQHHLAAWRRQAPRARVVAIADPSVDAAQARASDFDIERVYPSAEAMLEAGGVDALDVAAPREAHAALVRLAAAHGLPVLCQKPLAPTYAEAAALSEDVASRVRLMVHENWRFRPYYREIARWLGEGRIGRVLQAQMTLLTSGLVPDAAGRLHAIERQPFLASLSRALVMEVAIHHIDTLRFLFGELTLKHARLGRTCPVMVGEDRAFASFETAAGAPVVLLANLAVHGEPPELIDRLRIHGERGSISLDGGKLVCEGERPACMAFDPNACYLDAYAGAIGHFVDALAAETGFETGPDDNLRTLRLVEDIYEQGGLQ